jgi:Flp pilus assembly protein TadD
VTRAETLRARSLQHNKNNASLRLYMGIAKMELGKWSEARHYLRTPAREMRKDPEPRSLLGVTYVELGDFAGAHAQRDALVKIAAACEGSCVLAN